jgi:ResB-like family
MKEHMTDPTASPLRETTSPTRARSPQSFFSLVIQVLSSFSLATALLLMLMLLTWLATLEQIDLGLHATLQKYFTVDEFFIVCDLKVPYLTMPLRIPMLGGWWVLALLFLNLLIGGIIRAKKQPKKIFIFLSHCGILFMILSAAVTQVYEERGTMDFYEGQTSNVAQDYYEHVVEIAEHTSGKPEKFHVIRGKYVMDLTEKNIRTVRLPELPFDIELTGYAINSEIRNSAMMPPADKENIVDGYYIFPSKEDVNAEMNVGACYAKVLPKSGAAQPPFIITARDFEEPSGKRLAHTVRVDGRVFTVDMRKFLWIMPFSVRLDRATAKYYPNTMKPESFESRVTRIENQVEAVADIRMNEPMRYAGMTFYQRMMGSGPAMKTTKPYSQLEVVRNPADKWPEYSLYVVTVGLVMHFLLRLSLFFKSSLKRFSSAS